MDDSRIQYEFASDSDPTESADDLEPIHTNFKPPPVEDMFIKEKSVYETIQDIQANSVNQIETVFLESDEEEGNTDMIEIEEPVPKTALVNPVHISQNQQTSPFRVRSIPPSKLTPSLVSNSQTIALHSVDSDPKKFLVIPKDVMPMLSKSRGPVTLTLPGVGSVVIQRPHEIFKKSQLSQPPPPPKEKKVFAVVYDPLTDPKYSCWKYRKGIKRDLEGFSMNDRLGFYKAEQKRAMQCQSKCNEMVSTIFHAIHMLKRQKSTMEKDRLCNIAKSIGNTPTEKPLARKKPGPKSTKLTPIQKKNLNTIISWKKRFLKRSQEDSSDSDYDPDAPKPKRRNVKRTTTNPIKIDSDTDDASEGEQEKLPSKKRAKPNYQSSESEEIEIENIARGRLKPRISVNKKVEDKEETPRKQGRPKKEPKEETPIKVEKRRPNILRKSAASENVYAKTYNTSSRRKT